MMANDPTQATMESTPSLSRRKFISVSTKTTALGLLASGLPAGWVGAQTASESPESPNVNFGIIALTDCSPIVIAHEKGLFKKYGINSTVTKGASWAAIRDSLSNGDIQATHMLIGMPIASTMGLGGAPKKPMIIPWLLNRNGQSISLTNSLKGKVAADPKALKPLVDAAKAAGAPMPFAMTDVDPKTRTVRRELLIESVVRIRLARGNLANCAGGADCRRFRCSRKSSSGPVGGWRGFRGRSIRP